MRYYSRSDNKILEYSILDLKSHYRGYRYASETIKMLPQKPDAILLADIFQQIARLGAIHPAFTAFRQPIIGEGIVRHQYSFSNV